MKQVAGNLTDPVDGFLRDAKYLIHDRDPLFTEAFTAILLSTGVNCVKIAAKSPNCNPHAQRFVKTIKHECVKHFGLDCLPFATRFSHELLPSAGRLSGGDGFSDSTGKQRLLGKAPRD